MKALFILFVQILGTAALGDSSFFHSTFILPASAGPVQEIRIELRKVDSRIVAVLKSTLTNGEVRQGGFQCRPLKTNKYVCTRDDDGGAFTLTTKPQPILRFTYFNVAQDGEGKIIAVESPSSEPFEVKGMKSN
jgi:hypothetical protein